MGKQKRPVLEGEDDGEGHSWKVLKANGGAVDVYYGKGGHAKFQLKKADKTAPTEQLVLQRIADTATRRESSRTTTKEEAAGRRPKEVDSPQKQPLSLPRPRAACRRPARRKTAECRGRSHI